MAEKNINKNNDQGECHPNYLVSLHQQLAVAIERYGTFLKSIRSDLLGSDRCPKSSSRKEEENNGLPAQKRQGKPERDTCTPWQSACWRLNRVHENHPPSLNRSDLFYSITFDIKSETATLPKSRLFTLVRGVGLLCYFTHSISGQTLLLLAHEHS